MLKPLIAALLFVATVAAAPNEAQMARLQYFVGTWHCTWHAGTRSGNLDQVFSPALDGAWIAEQEIVTIDGRPKVVSLHYTGYDASAKEYVHVGPDADGSYEIAHSVDGDTWTNSQGRFVFRRLSQNERTMTAIAPDGKALESMDCSRT